MEPFTGLREVQPHHEDLPYLVVRPALVSRPYPRGTRLPPCYPVNQPLYRVLWQNEEPKVYLGWVTRSSPETFTIVRERYYIDLLSGWARSPRGAVEEELQLVFLQQDRYSTLTPSLLRDVLVLTDRVVKLSRLRDEWPEWGSGPTGVTDPPDFSLPF